VNHEARQVGFGTETNGNDHFTLCIIIAPVKNMATPRNLVLHEPNLCTVCPKKINPSESRYIYVYTIKKEIHNTGLHVNLEIYALGNSFISLK
jgi:hypothetical protein